MLDSAVVLCFQCLDRRDVPREPFKAIASIKSGGTPRRGTAEYYGGDIPWAKIGDLTAAGRWIDETEETISEEGLNSSSARIFPAGVVLFSMYGSIGKTTITRIPMATNQAILGLEPQDSVTADFLYYALMYARNALFRGAIGTSQMNINAGMVKGFEVPVPPPDLMYGLVRFLSAVEDGSDLSLLVDLPEPIEEQRGIVAKIERLAEKVEEAKRVADLSAGSSRSLVASYTFRLFAKTLHGKVPTVPLGEISEIQSGVTLGRMVTDARLELPYLRVANVQDGYLDLSVVKTVLIRDRERDKWLLRKGDLLLTEGGDWDKLGRGTIWDEEIPDCIHQNHIFRIRVDQSEFDSRYLLALTGSPYGKEYFQGASKQTTNLASINQKQLKAFPVYRLPLADQMSIVARLERMKLRAHRLLERQMRRRPALDALLPSILDKAFKGEL